MDPDSDAQRGNGASELEMAIVSRERRRTYQRGWLSF
jgi:hypothetical protein